MRFLILLCAAAILATACSLSATTAGDLTADLRLLIAQSDSTTGRTDFSDAVMRQALNLSQGAIAPLVGGVEWDTTIGLKSDSVRYPLGTNVIAVEGVWRVNKNDYYRLQMKRGRDFGLGRDTVQSVAANQTKLFEYKFHRGTLTIFPKLTGLTPVDSLEVDLYRYPNRMDSAAATFELPEYTRFAVIKLAEYILRNNDFAVGEEGAAMANLQTIAAMFVDRYARRGFGGQQ